MSKTVSDQILQRLQQWGVKRIYGYPGDGINVLMGAFGRFGDGMKFIQARHEELAAFMACAHAKFTGEVGVCMATSGPGAIHLLNGLYDARADHQPVLAIVGQQARAALGGDYQQEVDLLSLFKDVAHEFVHMATVPEQVRHLVDRGKGHAPGPPPRTRLSPPALSCGRGRVCVSGSYSQRRRSTAPSGIAIVPSAAIQPAASAGMPSSSTGAERRVLTSARSIRAPKGSSRVSHLEKTNRVRR